EGAFAMKRKERVLRAIEFTGPDRVPFSALVPGVSDIFFMTHAPARDWQPEDGLYPHTHPVIYHLNNWRFREPLPDNVQSPEYDRQDEFGCKWRTTVENSMGEVFGHPLADWKSLDTYKLPDPFAPGRLDRFDLYRKLLAGDSFVVGNLENGPMERSHFLRGYGEFLMDTVAEKENLCRLLDKLIDEWHVPLLKLYASRGAHAVIMTDDWGTQKSLMIRPAVWKDIFKPRYARLFDAAHSSGLKFILHSCGYIADIIPDLIEIGLDVLQKDDMAFMGLEELAELAAGKICFMGPLDMQRTLPGADEAKIFAETKRLLELFASHDGGFIGMYYTQPDAVGITWRQMLVMHAAFIRYGKYPI
ncbi:MAG TPA: uroporphyrinogen decarboxylase family protein, partial [bacterium]|nr:uroporphyrinogen decarboxylase family protein [bacterium]